VKRTHRISIEIEQRKLSFSFTSTAQSGVAAQADSESVALEPLSSPAACLECGANWIAVTALEGELAASSVTAIHGALQQRGLHVHISPSGQFRICSKSLEEFRFQETKESI
jgi:hypothetical protein